MPSQPKKTAVKSKAPENEIVPVPVVPSVSDSPPVESKVDVSSPPPVAPKKTRKSNTDDKKTNVTDVAKESSNDSKDVKEVKDAKDVKDVKEGEENSGENSTTTDNSIQVLVDKITSMASLIKEIQTAIKPVVKEHDKLRKIVDRIQKKRDNARKSPSGFAKPNKISDELCDFIGVPHGTEKSRTEITRYINAYVKEHNLNKPTNRRIILPDDKLKKILKTNNDEEVTFFILQRLISHHFPSNKNTTVVASS